MFKMVGENLQIDGETLNQLRIAIVKKYGMLYGHLKREVVKAIQEHAKKLEEEMNEQSIRKNTQ
jgi:hypothetical protein